MPAGTAATAAVSSPRGCATDHVEHEPDGQHPDRAAREREVERHAGHRQHRRREHAHPARLAPARAEVHGEQHAQRARDPHRVPVRQRERDPLGQKPSTDGKCARREACEQARERDGDERRRCPPEQHRRSPTRATALPVSTRTSAYSSVRSNSVSARPGASDQAAEASVQIANSASAPEASASAGLHPANGLLATVIRTTRARQRVNPTRPTWPGKKPPARKANHAVSRPDRVTSGPRRPRRTNVGLTRRPLMADNRGERGN